MNRTLKSLLRALYYPREILLSEQFAYGHIEIYRRFFGFEPNAILLAELQHGWVANPESIPQNDFSIRLRNRRLSKYPLLVWSRKIEKALNHPIERDVYAVCSPWFLLITEYEKLRAIGLAPSYFESPGSALYFPAHSFPGFDFKFDVNKTETILKSQKFSSITTSLYWLDFINPSVREHFSRFSKITCMGFRAPAATETPWHDAGGRVNFLYQLHKVIMEHQFIVCAEFSTAAMAALTLGKQVFICEDKVQYELVHRSEKNPIVTLDNSLILRNFGIKKSASELGYDLSGSSKVLELAQSGFGFDVSVEETKEILESFMGNLSNNLQCQIAISDSRRALW